MLNISSYRTFAIKSATGNT